MKIYLVTQNNRAVCYFNEREKALAKCLKLAENLKYMENFEIKKINYGYARLFSVFQVVEVKNEQ